MKRYRLLPMLLLAACVAFAADSSDSKRPGPPPGGKGGKEMTAEQRESEELTQVSQKITLQAAQSDSLKAIFLSFHNAMPKPGQGSGPPSSTTMDSLATIRDARVAKVLDATQYSTYQSLIAERKSKSKGGPGKRQ